MKNSEIKWSCSQAVWIMMKPWRVLHFCGLVAVPLLQVPQLRKKLGRMPWKEHFIAHTSRTCIMQMYAVCKKYLAHINCLFYNLFLYVLIVSEAQFWRSLEFCISYNVFPCALNCCCGSACDCLCIRAPASGSHHQLPVRLNVTQNHNGPKGSLDDTIVYIKLRWCMLMPAPCQNKQEILGESNSNFMVIEMGSHVLIMLPWHVTCD